MMVFRHSSKINPLIDTVVKFLPNSPPIRGEIILVNNVRSKVTSCKVDWDGPHWTIRSLRVVKA